ncbi:MAG: tetratricopeptide repeat protein [Verrucomicrobia bacterium]|nr:tetratricopeptide repeat protein [Verrucomicrobiota bacterium]
MMAPRSWFATGATVVFAALILIALPAVAIDFNAAFDSAGKSYEQGRYAESARAYESILAGGKTSAAIYYNLGNALFKDNRVGQAVYYYRQAERLSPRDPELQANLAFIRRAISGGTEAETDRWQQFLRGLSLNEWTWLALVPLWAWLLLLALGQWRTQWKAKLRGYTVTGGAMGGVTIVLLVSALNDHYRAESAVVTVKESVVRYGPLAESKSYFTLRDGAEVTILDTKDGWLQVLDASQRFGWLRKEQVIFVNARPPIRSVQKS